MLAVGPLSPRSLAAALEAEGERREDASAFVEIVRTTLAGDPALVEQILAPAAGADEYDRTQRFLAAVDRHLFPVDEILEEYGQVVRAVPITPHGLEPEDLEERGGRPGREALIALVAGPEAPAAVARAEDLHRGHGVPLETLALLPAHEPPPDLLERCFGGGPYAAVVDFGRWLAGSTGTAFLDCTYETLAYEWWDWDPRAIAELTLQWQQAGGIMRRVGALCDWLEGDLPARLHELAARLAAGADDGP